MKVFQINSHNTQEQDTREPGNNQDRLLRLYKNPLKSVVSTISSFLNACNLNEIFLFYNFQIIGAKLIN